MRRSLIVAAILLATAMPVPASTGSIAISEILPDPGSGREFIELHASGALDMTGWTIGDAAGNTFTFGATTLAAGQRIVVWGGGEGDARGPAWSRASVWNNGGDVATLRDASGVVVDVLAYGSSSWPDGRNDTVPAAPATGQSLSLWQDRWVETQPTPGAAPHAGSGTMGAAVANAPPRVSMAAPASSQPGQTIVVDIDVDDPNGDLAGWQLNDHQGTLHNGTVAGARSLSVVTPDRDTWTLTLTAMDSVGANSTVHRTISIVAAGLSVIVPPGAAFPSFLPGQAEVVSSNITLRNDGDITITPRIDVSDLTGPDTIPVAGRLSIGSPGEWTAYEGPLTALPALAPGESRHIAFRLTDIPVPLAAGDYGTSFAVVA